MKNSICNCKCCPTCYLHRYRLKETDDLLGIPIASWGNHNYWRSVSWVYDCVWDCGPSPKSDTLLHDSKLEWCEKLIVHTLDQVGCRFSYEWEKRMWTETELRNTFLMNNVHACKLLIHFLNQWQINSERKSCSTSTRYMKDEPKSKHRNLKISNYPWKLVFQQ